VLAELYRLDDCRFCRAVPQAATTPPDPLVAPGGSHTRESVDTRPANALAMQQNASVGVCVAVAVEGGQKRVCLGEGPAGGGPREQIEAAAVVTTAAQRIGQAEQVPDTEQGGAAFELERAASMATPPLRMAEAGPADVEMGLSEPVGGDTVGVDTAIASETGTSAAAWEAAGEVAAAGRGGGSQLEWLVEHVRPAASFQLLCLLPDPSHGVQCRDAADT
jgi:hypothetical protein